MIRDIWPALALIFLVTFGAAVLLVLLEKGVI
jgi:hypothetical protein